jgi:hypothetical protein
MNLHTKIVPLFILISIFITQSNPLNFDDIPRDIAIAFKVGTAKELSRFFNENLELEVEGKENVYSRSQAERIMDNFFTKYPPKDFKFVHKGGKKEAQYAIGKLVTFNGNFRVYMLLKTKNEKKFIHQLRIEKENE